MPRRRIIIAAQSPISRARIGKLLSSLPEIDLVGEATCAADAAALVDTARPDLAVLGASIAGGRGFAPLRARLIAANCRWIEIAGLQPGEAGTGRALPVLQHGFTPPEAAAALAAVMAAPADPGPAAPPVPEPAQPSAAEPAASAPRAILIGASTGGVDALIEILSTFPADCPPTAIVQHTGRAHAESLIQLLGQACRAEVVAPRDGMELRRGMVCVAAGGDRHLRLRAGSALRCLLHRGEPVSGHLPSVDELFHSAAAWADRTVGVLLTGMGRDGAAGLAALRRGGAVTLAQDEATSLVYGMPRAAWEMGAVDHRLPLPAIAEAALRASQRGPQK